MALTDPYVPDVVARLAATDVVERVAVVTAYQPADGVENGRVLDLTTGTLTIDEDRAPRFELNAAIGLGDQDLLDYLDPRAGTRLRVDVGYVYPDRTRDVHPIADLGLLERVVRRPQADVTLRAGSDEMRVMDWIQTAPVTYAATTPIRTVLAALLTAHGGDAAAITARRASTQLGEALVVEPGREWEAVQDLVDRIDAIVYHDGLNAFVVEDQVLEAGASAARVETGPRGTLTYTEVALERTEFANLVVVEYRWTDSAGVEQVRRGHAQVATGPYGTATIGRVGRVKEFRQPGTVAAAQAAAAAMLPRTISRGRRIHVEAAVAAYWLRPGRTVTLRFPLGDDERAIVAQLVYDLPTGTMSLTTRQPETITVETGA